jgi:LacI family transcriptional regulator
MIKKLTSIDIARLAGVSQTTVSRVLHDAASVTPKTKEKVLSLIRKHSYLPNAAARQMKTNRSNTIAVVVANLSNPLYPLMLRMMVKSLDLKGYRTIVWEQDEGIDHLINLSESSVDGIVFATATDGLLKQLINISSQKPIKNETHRFFLLRAHYTPLLK